MNLSKSDNKIAVAVCLFLCALVWLVFGQTLSHGFTNYDDEKYVFKNAHVSSGLNAREIGWAFTHAHAANWHPVTWISHMLDCQLFGLNPRGHHLTNVALHAVGSVLLFLVLRQMTDGPSRTGDFWRSAFVAALFAIHPLRVESVAWIAERKDVLSGVFFMLTLGAYIRYARRPSVSRYITMSILCALALMSKPMVVTLPFLLLLLDHWPLNRIVDLATLRKMVIEKIPLFALSAVSCAATLVAQRESIDVIANLSWPWRVGNAGVAAVTYLWQMIWPRDLAVFYPHPKTNLPLSNVAVAVILLVAISLGVFVLRRTRPYLFTGWFWFLGMLIPVLGIVQVGWQAHADRYTYLPLIGLFLAATWAIVDLMKSWPRRREILAVGAVLIITALTVQARLQTSYWRDNESLWSHAIAVTSGNATAHNNLGTLLGRRGQFTEAIAHFENAVAIDPTVRKAHFNWAAALMQTGNTAEAIVHYEKELQNQPESADTENNLANALMQADRTEEAIEHFRRFLQLRPTSATGHYNLAVALDRSGRASEAESQYEQALALKPDYANARRNLNELRQERN
ncbi:MAG: tetratricopeptide repeat protein [Spartobacteria bacterium]